MTENRKEQEVLMVMRKVLTSIIRETTPPPGQRRLLSDEVITDVRMCLGLITARERELADIQNIPKERPYFTDEPPAERVVSFHSIRKPGAKPNEE